MQSSKGPNVQKFGDVLVDFSLPLIGGGQRALSSFLTDRKAVVVVFWSSICSHCRRYDDYLNGFAAAYPEVGLVAVACREGEEIDQLQAAFHQRKLHFALLYDDDRSVARAWFVEQTPRVFLLDSHRQLVYRGAIDNFKYPQDPEFVAYLDQAVEALLAGEEPTRREAASFGCPVESVYYQMPKPLRWKKNSRRQP